MDGHDFFELWQFCNQMSSKEDVIFVGCIRGRDMRHAFPRFSILAVSLGITGLFAIGHPAEVRAQTIFCPATIPGSRSPNQVVGLSNGSCTNGQDGAFLGRRVGQSGAQRIISDDDPRRPRRN